MVISLLGCPSHNGPYIARQADCTFINSGCQDAETCDAIDIRYGHERYSHRSDPLCSFSHTDWAVTRRICEGDGWPGTTVAFLFEQAGPAYLTGVGQIACGMGVLFSIYPGLGAAEAGCVGVVPSRVPVVDTTLEVELLLS